LSFFRLFRSIILRHFRFEWGKLSLSIVGVTIGVTVFVAIRLANTTAFRSFTTSLDQVAGRANLQLLSNDGLGFDERTIAKLRQVRAVQGAAPVVEQYAQVDDSLEAARVGAGTPILVFGVDVFAEEKFRTYSFERKESGRGNEEGLRFLLEPDAIIITTKLARQYRLDRGDTIRLIAGGKRLTFRVNGIIEPTGTASALGGNFALLDIASAQEVFGRTGRLDRIDLLVPDEEREGIKEYLATIVPKGTVVQEPSSRSAQTRKMIEAFDLNLTALAFIALFVSMFIIYNTLLTNTLRRRRELGILRALGATRSLIIALFLGEAALIGLIGVALGLPLGVWLARLALDQVVRSVTSLYILTVAKEIVVDPLTLVIGGTLGLLASVLSAVPPAIEASRAHPRETFSLQTLEAKVSLGYRRIVIASLLLLAAAYVASRQGQQLNSPLLGFASAGLLLVGAALLTPVFIRVANGLLGKLIRKIFGVEGELAKAYLMQSLGRTSTAVAALMTAIAMLIGISTMIGSFRRTVEYWMRQTVTADLYMTVSTNRLAADVSMPMPEEMIRYLDSLPELRTVDALRWTRVGYAGRTISIRAARLNVPERDATILFQKGSWDRIIRALDSGAIAISESFSIRFGKDVGDTITLATPTGAHSMRVAGIYYDYTTDAGTILMRKNNFARLFADSTTTNVALYLRDPSRLEETRAEIERRFSGRYDLLIYSNRSLREEALTIFDQTFAITYALQFVAVVVAAIGVANTLAALVVERSREIGILKAIGATAGQLRKMTLVQAGLIGLASQTLGIAAGLALSAILIYVINRVSFGWTIQFEISPEVMLSSTLLVVATAFLAGIAPANAAARKRVAEVVQVE
jgi:putative ABC transport system permease protein